MTEEWRSDHQPQLVSLAADTFFLTWVSLESHCLAPDFWRIVWALFHSCFLFSTAGDGPAGI
jgi:hypothetical protein